jgi:hypothetical protein
LSLWGFKAGLSAASTLSQRHEQPACPTCSAWFRDFGVEVGVKGLGFEVEERECSSLSAQSETRAIQHLGSGSRVWSLGFESSFFGGVKSGVKGLWLVV